MEIKAERKKIRSGLRLIVNTEDLNMIQGSKTKAANLTRSLRTIGNTAVSMT